MKRRLTKLVVFLLLGAVVNVAVAWGCALRELWNSLEGHEPTDYDIRWWDAHVPEGFPAVPDEVGEQSAFGVSETFMFSERSSQPISPPSVAIRRRAGLPMRSLEGSAWGDYRYGRRRVIEQSQLKLLKDRERFPLRPIWPGFAINTVLYATILWLLTLASIASRRFDRRKRGRCINCGYDLRGASGGGGVCPECGAQSA